MKEKTILERMEILNDRIKSTEKSGIEVNINGVQLEASSKLGLNHKPIYVAVQGLLPSRDIDHLLFNTSSSNFFWIKDISEKGGIAEIYLITDNPNNFVTAEEFRGNKFIKTL